MIPILKAVHLQKIYGDPDSHKRVVALEDATLDLFPREVADRLSDNDVVKMLRPRVSNIRAQYSPNWN